MPRLCLHLHPVLVTFPKRIDRNKTDIIIPRENIHRARILQWGKKEEIRGLM
jgi:hypothetical protein